MPTRSYRHLSVEERETLSLGLTHGHSVRTMASVLGRPPPHRESRGGPQHLTWPSSYRASTAPTQAAARAHQPRRPRKLADPWRWEYVRTKLTQGCSPEQSAGRHSRLYPGDMSKQLSAETIYAAL